MGVGTACRGPAVLLPYCASIFRLSKLVEGSKSLDPRHEQA
jgi:hypothetical protein